MNKEKKAYAPGIPWREIEKNLNLTAEDEEEIRLEEELIAAICEAREEKGMTQQMIAKESGLTQSAVSRVEKCVYSPRVDTLIKYLLPMGYELAIRKKKSSNSKNSQQTQERRMA